MHGFGTILWLPKGEVGLIPIAPSFYMKRFVSRRPSARGRAGVCKQTAYKMRKGFIAIGLRHGFGIFPEQICVYLFICDFPFEIVMAEPKPSLRARSAAYQAAIRGRRTGVVGLAVNARPDSW